MCMMLEITYFRAESLQLIVSRSDSELEVQRCKVLPEIQSAEIQVQRYGTKKNTVIVDPVMLQDEL